MGGLKVRGEISSKKKPVQVDESRFHTLLVKLKKKDVSLLYMLVA